eukprot:3023064-Rhodomonas_salina.1
MSDTDSRDDNGDETTAESNQIQQQRALLVTALNKLSLKELVALGDDSDLVTSGKSNKEAL